MIHFLGGTSKVTGSSYLLKNKDISILIDCGMEQEYNIEVKDIIQRIDTTPKHDITILTHAHIDHSGLIPLLFKKKKTSAIYSTPATKELCRLLLNDFVKVRKQNGQLALYSEKDVDNCFDMWYEKDEQFIVNNTRITFYNSSHIIGSVSVFIETATDNYLFSGDIGTKAQEFLNYPPQLPKTKINNLIIESTYGDKIHQKNQRENFIKTIEGTCDKDGTVLIPAFAIGRVQEILYSLSDLDIKYPIYIDTPLGIQVTSMIERYRFYLAKELINKEKLFGKFISIITKSQHEQLKKNKEPAIIISASGMLEGGRSLSHYENLRNDPKNHIIFVGYQAENTKGSKVLNGIEKTQAQISRFSAFSAHADKEELLEYVKKTNAFNVYIVHGEKKQRKALQEEIKKELNSENVFTPIEGDIVEQIEQKNNQMPVFSGKPIVAKIPLDAFSTIGEYRVMPVVGAFIEKDNCIELVSIEDFNNIMKKEAAKVYSSIQPNITEEKDITNDIFFCLQSGVFTKNRLRNFLEKLQIGTSAAEKYIYETHEKNINTGERRWNQPIKSFLETKNLKEEDVYLKGYETLQTLAKMSYQRASNILQEIVKGI